MTFHQLLDLYYEWVCKNRAPSTVAERAYTIASLKRAIPTNLHATHLRPSHIATWIEDFTQAKSPGTIRGRWGFAQGVYAWAVRWGHLKENPLANVEKPNAPPRESFLRGDQVPTFLRAARRRGRAFSDCVEFILDTGCRVREFRILTAEHYDNEQHCFRLTAAESKGGWPRTIYCPTRSQRIVMRTSVGYTSGPLFRNSENRAWGIQALRYHFSKVVGDTGIRGLCPTALRHTFAYLRLQAGQSPEIVAKLLGHGSTQMVYKIYGHMEQGDLLRNAANEVQLV